jgi:Na+/H+ antiporter NhaD/arsenite permease-like protein
MGSGQAHGGAIGLTSPWHYYWATGFLSGFLDNAPTYLAFASGAAGNMGVSTIGALATGHAVTATGATSSHILAAISCGAVMMGALTYVGNAPNMVVKSLAENAGVKMPSFFGYMRYSLAVLIPIFVIVTLVFFI